MTFKKANNIVGWLAFLIAYIVYILTMERTVSFWDCGEFISTAYRLEVGHSPGAPLFMLLGRLFGMAASPVNVALFINSLSALASAFTILFLFWTITHFANRLLTPAGDENNKGRMIAVLGAGLIGSLAYTFSDTFWFSAVEAEVYATSSFFTAIVFWAILKWEHQADSPHADRWILLIAYLMGLSVGVHLLNLLTIPAIAIVYYFKKKKANLMGTILAFLIGIALLGAVQFGIIQGIPILASKFELAFVNTLGMPLNSGAIFFLILLISILTYLIIWARKKAKYHLHLGLLCFVFIMIGYSSYITTIIRSKADVPIDMTNPDDVLSLVSYLQRDQYGSQPILFGPDYNTEAKGFKKGTPVYKEQEIDGKKKYVQVGNRQVSPEYDASDERFFPRIWSSDPSHERFYRQYLNIAENESPSGIDNLRFFFNYQTNWMWWRYFMWNYVGRQNDFQGTSYGEAQNGNWISGIGFIDEMLGRGDASLMPDYLKNNRARNTLFFLPFLLGLMGLVYQFNRSKKDGIIVILLFFFTGWAIVMYLNNTPQQPRERDYAYAGATYAFAIWIGLGVLMLTEWLKKPFKKMSIAASLATLIALIAVPTLMAVQEWDDHDRSQKTLARSTAYNVLSGLDSNAILFVTGDNDTYPLWYMQEVEGFRTDVRIINLSLLGIDWYLDQLSYKINDADAVPMIWKSEDYVANKRDFVIYRDLLKSENTQYNDLEEVLKFITLNNENVQIQLVTGDYVNILPTKRLSIPVDKEAVLKNGLVPKEDADKIEDRIYFTLPDSNPDKSNLGVLNIIAGVAKNGWNRPIYFSCGFPGGSGYQGLDEYVELEGLANKLVPIHFPGSSPDNGAPQQVNLEKSFQLFTQKFQWGGAEKKNIYFDEKNKVMLMTYRLSGVKIADAFIREGQNEKAIQLLDKITQNISYESYQYDQSMLGIVAAYYQAGALDKGRTIAMRIMKDNSQLLNYLLKLKGSKKDLSLSVDGYSAINAMQYMVQIAETFHDMDNAHKWKKEIEEFSVRMQMQ